MSVSTERYPAFESKAAILQRLHAAANNGDPITWDDVQKMNNTDTSALADPTATLDPAPAGG